mmetsp:Transcript_55024/g.170460  ORF Transcript_55024/g.170460 Transcript_55024/m.170460 type:complete len:417 (-) Transcript_55024:164-1414(-)
MATPEAKPAFIVFNAGGPFDIIPPSGKYILGQYAEDGTWNHGKKVYRRIPTEEHKFLPELKLFFWDDSDGKDLAGWWFGDNVGSGKVWSRNVCVTPLPPMTGWQCPADGPVQEHIRCVQPVTRPVGCVKFEPPGMPTQVRPPGPPKRRWGGSLPSSAPPAKRPERAGEVAAETFRLVSSLGKEAPWGTQHLLGEYVAQGQNHGRRAFCRRRDPRDPEEQSIWLYYWDLRDGPEATGWWLGRRIGGRERYGRAESHEVQPPSKGWRVPPDGIPRQDLSCVAKGQSEETVMTEDARLAAASATVEGAEAEAYQALEASLHALGERSGVKLASVHTAMDRLKESTLSVEEAMASLDRHERAARRQTGIGCKDLGPLRERLQVVLESVQQELSRASWVLERPPAGAEEAAGMLVKEEPSG